MHFIKDITDGPFANGECVKLSRNLAFNPGGMTLLYPPQAESNNHQTIAPRTHLIW
jgi:hypothetical protein